MPQRNYKYPIWVLTIAINGLIALAFFLPKIIVLSGHDFSKLPFLNAILNALTFCSLMIALLAIRRKKIPLHRTFVLLAFSFTSLFLFSYLLYHFSTPSTKYGGDGILRGVYFFILGTHVFLAALIVPLVLLTMAFGLNNQINRHRRIARWTMPIWLYVSSTGVIVYLLISPYYH
jgi:putative membrane protein